MKMTAKVSLCLGLFLVSALMSDALLLKKRSISTYAETAYAPGCPPDDEDCKSSHLSGSGSGDGIRPDTFNNYKENNGKNWVLLVAGSRYYNNYRHQADVCHAYQIVHSHGIPDEQIVVMMYDDIAHSEENPYPGELINHPDGPNVYTGVPKDYTGEDVTPENFIDILTGKKNKMKEVGSGKVIDSGPDDHVFVYFADHGAPGLLGFPSSQLYRDDLEKAIKYMYTNKKYSQLIFYVEACESQSMFYDTTIDNFNVYATTAANRHEPSYACYYDKARSTYLGDRYSVTWMEDSDKKNLNIETLHAQYEVAKAGTTQSHVMEYGRNLLGMQPVSYFQGSNETSPKAPLREIYDDILASDVQLHILRNKLLLANSSKDQSQLQKKLGFEYTIRSAITNAFDKIAMLVFNGATDFADEVLYRKPQLHNLTCYKAAIKMFDKVCFDLEKLDFAYRKVYVLSNLCDEGVPANRIIEAIQEACGKK